MTAILRARATFARFEPRRLATSIPQRLSFENRVMRASRTLAASYSAVRAISPPARVTHRNDGNAQLTARELEVLTAMADGATNKAIARRLGISFHTVKFHVAAILEKLDADTRTEAVMKAAQLGIVML